MVDSQPLGKQRHCFKGRHPCRASRVKIEQVKLVWISLKTTRITQQYYQKVTSMLQQIHLIGHILWGTCSKQNTFTDHPTACDTFTSKRRMFFSTSRCKCGSNVSKWRPSSIFFSAPRHILPTGGRDNPGKPPIWSNLHRSTAVKHPETNSEFTPENGWLEYFFFCFLFGMAYFQGRTVSSREGRCASFFADGCFTKGIQRL